MSEAIEMGFDVPKPGLTHEIVVQIMDQATGKTVDVHRYYTNCYRFTDKLYRIQNGYAEKHIIVTCFCAHEGRECEQ